MVFVINAFTPGDPVAAMLGNSYTQEEYDAKTIELGLDKPWIVQFFSYLKGVVTEFDLGTSYQSQRQEQSLPRGPRGAMPTNKMKWTHSLN